MICCFKSPTSPYLSLLLFLLLSTYNLSPHAFFPTSHIHQTYLNKIQITWLVIPTYDSFLLIFLCTFLLDSPERHTVVEETDCLPTSFLTDWDKTTQTCCCLFYVCCSSFPFSLYIFTRQTGLPEGWLTEKSIFVGAQVLQMTFGVYICTPLCICVHVFAYWLCTGCWPFADKARSSGGPLVAGWYCLSVMPGSLGSCMDP